MFRDEEGITEIAVTLDKVTVQHRSFTVLLTLFFVDGKIYCALNDLLTMKEDDYDARGTAAMVVRTPQPEGDTGALQDTVGQEARPLQV